MSILQKLFGNKNQRELRRIQPLVARIAELEATLQAKSDAELRGMTAEFKRRYDKGQSLDDMLPEAFAVAREAGKRVLGMRHYDVQMVGGIVLHRGRIAEMRTGEGKTLVATLPSYLNALSGKGVHVVTVNDYLAKRDAEWMGRLHGFLGLSTGVVVHGLDDFERQRAYNCDITYGQNNEFGFDYLRDNMKSSPDRMVQRGLNYAVVDEVDSILIDEARTPLIISGAGEASADLYGKIDKMIPRLKREVDYTVDEKAHSAMLTDDGVERMEELLGVENLYAAENIALVHHVTQALKAHTLYKRNVNYLIEDDKVVIIDEHTGRKMPGRRWSDGLHQAIEAKEGVDVEEENQTVATVTFQNYFRMYSKLSGMTGTADTEAAEFHQIYKLEVTVIPTNKPIQRKDYPDLVFKNEAGKFRAVVAEIEEAHKRGQPVLVGTISVEKSEVVANLLRAKNLPYNVLNAKQHQREAAVVAQAGRKGAITIATNMAGRGTDILLGGNAEAMAHDAIAQEKAAAQEAGAQLAEPAPAEGEAGPYRDELKPQFDEDARLAELLPALKKQCAAEREEVLAAGGLMIIGTERHESRRIDNQLRGRAGRQGDPGASRFYLSLQDDLLRIFGLDRMTGLMERLGLEEDVPIESPMVTRSIEGAQKKVEGRNFDMRKNVLEYDDVMNQQRKTIYSLRKQILEGRYRPEAAATEGGETAADTTASNIPTSSGDWTVDSLAPEVKPALEEIFTTVDAKVAAQKADAEIGRVSDERPAWRLARAEVWRQFGTLLPDLEKRYDDARPALVDYASQSVAASLIQQRERVYDMCEQRISDIIQNAMAAVVGDGDVDWDSVEDALQEQFNFEFTINPGTADETAGQAWHQVEKQLLEREKALTRPWFMYFARHFALEEIDEQWISHLKVMEGLREGIGLQGYGQKDPKKEYKKAGFNLFSEMLSRVIANSLTKLFRVQIQREEAQVPALQQRDRHLVEAGAANKTDADVLAQELAHNAAALAGQTEEIKRRLAQGRAAAQPARAAQMIADDAKVEPVRRDKAKVGRNDPCTCGSGKKYKKCHGKDEEQANDAP